MRGLRLSLVLALCPIPGFPWGSEGHRLVARMAQDLLTPAAAERVEATLAPGETIASLASWADQVRPDRKETEPWHFIDIPISSTGLDMKRDCPKQGCVISKIAEFRKQWRDQTLPAAKRREALLFLVHFIGDMHQPLHCANDDDHGGNDVTVAFRGTRMNLHHLWDSGLLDRLPPEDELYGSLEREITPAEKTDWSRGTVEMWAEESFDAARKVVYGGLPEAEPGAAPDLGASYEQTADPVVRRQLEKAAVRLAAILNEMP